jgi:hypothetical protein
MNPGGSSVCPELFPAFSYATVLHQGLCWVLRGPRGLGQTSLSKGAHKLARKRNPETKEGSRQWHDKVGKGRREEKKEKLMFLTEVYLWESLLILLTKPGMSLRAATSHLPV